LIIEAVTVPRFKVNGIGNIGRIYPYLGSVPSKKVWSKTMESSEFDLTLLAADIVSAYVANNAIGSDKLPDLIGSVYGALSRASVQDVEPKKVELKPAVAIKKSVTPEYIICLEDGKKFKSLKRHLKSHYDMSPEVYREKWGLPHDYPMVAPSYAAARSDLAKNMGLGRRGAAVIGAQPEGPAKAEPAERSAKGSGKQARKARRGSRK
jgi:MucR family transcriptional regulator, transcriptional regulator of exopolysaccharide biosynthesis